MLARIHFSSRGNVVSTGDGTIMNLPNKLTVSRFVLTLMFVAMASIPEVYSNIGSWSLGWWKVGYFIAIIAGVTDFFDGYLARKYNLITDFGKLMDPLSDKVHTISSFVILTAHDVVPMWITCVILTREFAVNGLRTMAAKEGQVIAAKNIGKVKTVLQMLILALGGCFWVEYIDIDLENSWNSSTPLWFWTWKGLLWGIAALTVYSGIEYYWKGRKIYLNDM